MVAEMHALYVSCSTSDYSQSACGASTRRRTCEKTPRSQIKLAQLELNAKIPEIILGFVEQLEQFLWSKK